MIYLFKFPETSKGKHYQNSVQLAKIDKSDKSRIKHIAKNILLEVYSSSLAEKYSERVTKFMYNRINFPENEAFYQIKDGYLWKYKEGYENWENTQKKTEDYIIYPEDKLWKEFDENFPFLITLKPFFQKEIENETKTMFFNVDFNDIKFINIKNTGKVKFAKKSSFIKALEEFYTDVNTLKLIEAEIIELLKLPIKKNPAVLLSISGVLKYAIYEEEILKIDVQTFDFEKFKLSPFLNALEDEDKKSMMILLKNLITYGIKTSNFLVEKIVNGVPYGNCDGLNLKLVGHKWYVLSNTEMLNNLYREICKIVETITKDTDIAININGLNIKCHFKYNSKLNSKDLYLCTLSSNDNPLKILFASFIDDKPDDKSLAFQNRFNNSWISLS